MSGAMTVERPTAVAVASEPTPSFIGLVRGEVLKLTRSWLTWLLLVIVAGPVVFLFLVAGSTDRFKFDLAHNPLVYYYQAGEAGLSVFRVFSGIALIILTARLIGIEYSGGTIRVLLSRGVGRVQLMAAKLVTLALLALVMLAGGVLLVYIGSFGVAERRLLVGHAALRRDHRHQHGCDDPDGGRGRRDWSWADDRAVACAGVLPGG